MLEKILEFKRAELVELEHDRIVRMLEEIHFPTWSEFERTISPVWFNVLNKSGHNIEAIYRSQSSQELKILFEERGPFDRCTNSDLTKSGISLLKMVIHSSSVLSLKIIGLC